jgi:BirA family transcriptional regulator, biotin operon repressor / biotin---[acetyl-CoA-carboxylase] ligase
LSSKADWPEGVGRLVLEECDSTNAEALRRAGELTSPFWLVARRQTAGRGRRGRTWQDPKGNLAATLLMRPKGPAGMAALRSFTAALALFDTFVAFTGRAGPLALKWPNDVLLNGGKVAGILLESAGRGAGVQHLAIGFGVNLLEAPEPEPGALRPVSLAGETGLRIDAEEFLDRLAPAFATWEAQLESFGFGHVRNAWLARAARLGEGVIARVGEEALTGTFETIDDNGAMVLVTAQGRRVIPAADVHFT